MLTNLDRVTMEYALRFDFKTSNNGAKYEALIIDLEIAKELKVKELKVFTDS